MIESSAVRRAGAAPKESRALAERQPACCRRGALPASKGISSDKGRSRWPRRRIEARAAGHGVLTGPGAVAPRTGPLRRGRHRHSSRRKHDGGRLNRMSLLPAYIEIMLAAGDVQDARSACADCTRLATPRLRGVAADRGALRRRACADWTGLPCPWGEDSVGLEIGAAKCVFERLGATPDFTRIESLMKAVPSFGRHARNGTPVALGRHFDCRAGGRRQAAGRTTAGLHGERNP